MDFEEGEKVQLIASVISDNHCDLSNAGMFAEWAL